MVRSLRERVESELAQAREARAAGKEGRARVCARRAAGWAAAPLYESRTGHQAPLSALQLLRWLAKQQDLPQEVRAAARRLTRRVLPSYRLPHPEDPLQDARMLVAALLAEGAGDDAPGAR